MKQTTTLLLAGILTFSVTSCKKDKKTTTPDPEPVVNCDLVSEVSNGSSTTTYEYDSENRIIRELLNGSINISVEYLDGGNTVRETQSDAISTYQLNGEGFPITVLTETNNGSRSRTYYTYDANGFVAKMLSHSLNAQDSVIGEDSLLFTNTVANKNLIHQVTTGAYNFDITISHDLNRPNNFPNPRTYSSSFFTGGKKDKNLVSSASITNGNQSQGTNYLYLYDSKGRITRRTSITYSGGPNSYDTTYYKYRCD